MFANQNPEQESLFYYVNRQRLDTLLKNTIKNDVIRGQFISKISFAIDSIINKKYDFDFLIRSFKQEVDNWPYEQSLAALEILTSYVESTDFDFPGKYIKRSWFWGEINYIQQNKDNEFFNKLTSVFASLTKEYSNKIKQPIQQGNSENIRVSLDKGVFGYVILAATSFCPYTDALELAAPPSGLAGQPLQGFYLEQLPKYYHIISNTNLADVKWFFFGETHNNFTHCELQKYFLPGIASPGDKFLFESLSAGLKFDCGLYCLEWKQDYYQYYHGYGACQVVAEREHCSVSMGLGDKNLICLGADSQDNNREEINEAAQQIRSLDSLNDLNKEGEIESKKINDHYKNFNDVRERFDDISKKLFESEFSQSPLKLSEIDELNKKITALNNRLKKYFAVNNASPELDDDIKNLKMDPKNLSKRLPEINAKLSKWMSTSQQVIQQEGVNYSSALEKFNKRIAEVKAKIVEANKITARSDTVIIKGRNRDGIIKTMKDEKAEIEGNTVKFFTLYGSKHFVPRRVLDSMNQNPPPDLASCNDQDPQKELREYAEKGKYAILIPK